MSIYEHTFQGIHVFGEMYGIAATDLDNLVLLETALTKGIEASGATLCSMQRKQFNPMGVTLLGLLAESHTSIHTYPDQGALFFDAFTCGDRCQPQKIAEVLKSVLRPSQLNLKTVVRGKDLTSGGPD